MNKYGWEWKSEEAAEAYEQILAYVRNGSGFDGPKGIAQLLSLADKLVNCEGRIPDSFLVSVDLGIIYSSACLFEGQDTDLGEEFLAKAAEAWSIASGYLENGQPKATAGLDSNAAQISYMRRYRIIPCEIGFARYLRSDRKELSHLADIKAQWEQAAQEDPDHKVLKVIGKHIREDLMGGQIKPDLAHEERISGGPAQVSSSSPQTLPSAPAIAAQSHPDPALQIPVEAAPAPVAPSLRSEDFIELPGAQKSTPEHLHPTGKISRASAESGAAHDGSREVVPVPMTSGSQVESLMDMAPATPEAAPVPVPSSQLSFSSRRSIRSLITATLASVAVIVAAGYFAIDGFWKISTPQNAPSPPQTAAPSGLASRPGTANKPEISDLPEAPLANNPLAKADRQASPDLQVIPKAGSPPRPIRSGKAVYASSCRSCHATGLSGSPRLDDLESWKTRLARSRASLYASVVEGKGAMPPRGGDRSLRDVEIRRAVDFMVAEARTAAKSAGVAVPIPPATSPAASQPALAAPVAPVPATRAEGQADWLAAMRGELERCRQGNFFGRIMCTEKVRWKYCAPSRWNMVAECAA